MKKHLILTTLFLTSFILKAQSGFNSEDLTVTRQDLSTNYFAKDSTANAVVLYEYGNSYIDKDNYKLYTEIKKKIKILNKKGFEQATITELEYHSNKGNEVVKDITGTTYNLDGGRVTKTKLEKESIFEEEYDDNYTLVKFTFPNIKEGSVITYSYTIISPFLFKYKGWDFQDEIPKLYSEYNTSIPGNWEYSIKLVGYQNLYDKWETIRNNCLSGPNGSYANCSESQYIMKDIPAFIPEDYMTNKYNYLSRIEYELKTFRGFDGRVKHYTKTWDDVDKELRTDESFGRQLRKSSVSKELIPTEISEEPNLLKRAESIYHFIQENYTWNGEFHLMKDVAVKDLVKKGTGNSGEINILLHNVLEQNGIDVKPIILSTRANGFPTKIFPVLTDFNYIIVQASIDGNTYYLDATDKYMPFGELPYRCLNDEGRLLDFKEGSSWVSIEPKSSSNIIYHVKLKADNGKITGTVNTAARGYHSLPRKKSYYGNPTAYETKLLDQNENIEISNFEMKSENQYSNDLIEKFDVEVQLNEVADRLYFDPFLFKFFSKNPFKLQERTYPIDFGYKDSFMYSMEIDLGEDYSLIDLPESKNYSLPENSGRVIFTSTNNNNVVTLLLKIDFLKAKYEPGYYPYLKEFMNLVTNFQTKSLISLKRT
ncbi:DUF3857 domain-containing protein [Mangrovimonas futianensis]|uniref:DUF3857 domain-containing protein n=1 Tax=Mangrovimonas futianensis TaxID=2895523 RepID=UPI001E579EBF|nr:DUF3857 domain-containing protein [Mangrovimonas futianensis]MCF1422706.1 DUF3857 domain-containing protein [Mangrovimonas futianensis]